MTKAEIIAYLGANKHRISRQQLLTLRGQALAGNVEAAEKGLAKILRRQDGKDRQTEKGI